MYKIRRIIHRRLNREGIKIGKDYNGDLIYSGDSYGLRHEIYPGRIQWLLENLGVSEGLVYKVYKK